MFVVTLSLVFEPLNSDHKWYLNNIKQENFQQNEKKKTQKRLNNVVRAPWTKMRPTGSQQPQKDNHMTELAKNYNTPTEILSQYKILLKNDSIKRKNT